VRQFWIADFGFWIWPRSIFLALLCAFSMLAAPPAAEAQQAGKVYRIGVLSSVRPLSAEERARSPFILKLRELGWVEGQNVVIKERHADGNLQRLPGLAAELLSSGVDIIVTWGGTPPTLAAKQATQTIPIVFPSAGDPVEKGLVASLARPGGNVTGIANHVGFGKHLEVLKEAVPKLSRVAFLHNPAAFGSPEYLKASLTRLDIEARTLNLKAQPVPIHGPDELERVFADFMRRGPEGAYVDDVPATVIVRDRLCRLAIQHRLAVISRARLFPDAGCLLSYGEHRAEKFRQAAVLVDKILRGAKPADIPVEQPAKFELVINLKTAKALGLTIPQSVLIRADEIIQ
jgi:putative tryptophan/tyrosine transport system substrate-binding protein